MKEETGVSEWLVCSCRVPWVQVIVVVVAKENMDLMMDIVQRFQHGKVRVVPGGSTRHRSICNGVMALSEEAGPAADRATVVIIHDAVRPFVEEDLLQEIAMAAKEQGVSTIKLLIIRLNGLFVLYFLNLNSSELKSSLLFVKQVMSN